MDLAYVEKPSEDNNGVGLLLVPRDLFEKTLNAKKKTQQIAKKTVEAFQF